MSPASLDALVAAAVEVRKRAYAPYSKFLVGAALQLRDGRIVTGVNVENCSYGLTVCAERNAIFTAVAQQNLRPGDVTAVAVAAYASEVTAPCGACRQVLAEFTPLDTPVILHNVRNDAHATHTLRTLLPHAFTPASLNEAT